MSDTKSGDDKTLSVTSKPMLTLKRPAVELSKVHQNFSHGRNKTVVVETKKSKFSRPLERPEASPNIARPAMPVNLGPVVTPLPPRPVQTPLAPVAARLQPAPVAPAPAPVVARAAPQPAAAPAPKPAATRPSNLGMVLNVLSNDEMAARRKALAGANFRDDDERRRVVDEARRRNMDEALRKREADDSAKRQAEEDTRIKLEADLKRRAEDEARRRTPSADAGADVSAATPGRTGVRRPMSDMDDARPSRGPSSTRADQARLRPPALRQRPKCACPRQRSPSPTTATS